MNKKLIIALLIAQAVLLPNAKAFATIGQNYVLDTFVTTGGSGFSYWGLIPYGASLVGSLAYSAFHDKTNGISDSSTWSIISEFESSESLTNSEMQNALSARGLGNPFSENEKNVSLLTAENKQNTSGQEKNFLVEGSGMKQGALHLHYIEISEELLKSKQKLVAETTLIYKNAQNQQLDFEFIKNPGLNKLEKALDKGGSEKLIAQGKNNTVLVSQKQVKISKTQKPYTLAIYIPQNQQDETSTDNYTFVKYTAVVKVKPVGD